MAPVDHSLEVQRKGQRELCDQPVGEPVWLTGRIDQRDLARLCNRQSRCRRPDPTLEVWPDYAGQKLEQAFRRQEFWVGERLTRARPSVLAGSASERRLSDVSNECVS